MDKIITAKIMNNFDDNIHVHVCVKTDSEKIKDRYKKEVEELL